MTKETGSDGTLVEKTWDCCHLLSATDAKGMKTDFSYDALGRVTSASQPGPSGTITTSYTYDAAGRKLSQTVAAGGLTQATSNVYDSVGRMTQAISADGLVTQYAYINAGRTTTITRPGGATEITERHLDGRVKGVYGTAVVERSYSYDVNSGGTYVTVYSGGGTALWEKTITDSLDRVVKTEKPGFGGGLAVTENTYNNLGQLIKTQTTGQAAQMFEYDELGNQIRSGLDVDNSGNLGGLFDRVTETDTSYVQAGGWWQQSLQKVYASDAPTVINTSRNRLSGLGSGLTTESVAIDASGNQIVSKTFIDRDSCTETRTIDYPDSNIDAQSVSENGFLMSSVSKTGVTTTYQYDGLGRQTGATDSRTGTSKTQYNAQGRVEYVEDSADNRTTYEYDETTGRKTSETNPLGNTTQYEYNTHGQVTRTSGAAAYPVGYEYNALGQMTAMHTYRTGSSGDGDTTTWNYDNVTGLLISKTDAAGNAATYTYDISCRLATRTWARKENGSPVTTTYHYDPGTGNT